MTYKDTLQAIYDDPHIWAQEDRAAVTEACLAVLAHEGRLHIRPVRAYLKLIDAQVAPHRIGANMHGFVRRMKLEPIGHAPNGDTKSGNRNKQSPIWARKEHP